MTSSIGFYHYHHDPVLYTGTEYQPDVMSLFVISETETPSFVHNSPIANAVGYFLVVSVVSGAFRVANAVQTFFKELSQVKKWEKEDSHLQECWNATKNFGRGFMETCPFTACFLFLYDLFRSKILVQQEIIKELKERTSKGQSTAGKGGIALDGRILFFIDLKDLKDENSKNPAEELTDPKRLEILDKQLSALIKAKEEERIKAIEQEMAAQNKKENEEKDVPDQQKEKKEHPLLKDFLLQGSPWKIIPELPEVPENKPKPPPEVPPEDKK